jgi:hypothetical protein
MENDDIGSELERALRRYITAEKGDYSEMVAAIRTSAIHLRSLAGDPGFAVAAIAERDTMALRFGIKAVRAGDRADSELSNAAMDIALAALMKV